MAEVFLNIFGNGIASTDALPPMVDGEPFTITFTPDPGEDLLYVKAFDSHDYAVALPPVVNDEIHMNFRSGWGNLYVDIYFSGSTPPPTPSFPFYILLTQNKWWQKRKY